MGRIGILGGTFNPIHRGHLMLAQAAYEQFELDRILVIPNKLPVYKDRDELLDSKQRSEMVRLAIAPYSYMEFSDMELKRKGATYTIDTLRILKEQYPKNQFAFIMGGDSLLYFHKWREYKEILNLTEILCAKRDEADLPALEEARQKLMEDMPLARIFFMDTPMIPISSTEIREHLYTDTEMRKWLPEGVWDFIQEHHLYSETK